MSRTVLVSTYASRVRHSVDDWALYNRVGQVVKIDDEDKQWLNFNKTGTGGVHRGTCSLTTWTDLIGDEW